jgi:chromosome segregation ATPase
MKEEQELRDALAKLHAELEKAETAEGSSRELLQQLHDDLHRVLDEEDDEHTHDDPEFVGRLREAFSQFEADHPAVSYVIGNVIHTLSAMGI